MGGIWVDSPSSVRRETAVPDLGTAVGGAVDVFDAVAHLESRGYGDTVARRLGHEDTFAMASSLMAEGNAPVQGATGRALRRDLITAFGRMVVMLCGVAISLSCLPAGVGQVRVFIAGATGWLCGQAISAGVWHGLGTGHRQVAAWVAVHLAPVLTAVAVGASLAIDSPAPLLWAVWSMSASVLVILRPGWALVTSCSWAAVVTIAATLLLPDARFGVACTMVALVAVAAVVVVWIDGGRRARVPAGAIGSAVLGSVQAAAQIALLWAVLQLVGDASFLTVAVAGLVAGAISDPILELAYSLVRQVVRHPTSWRVGRRTTALLGIVAVIAVVGCSMLTAWVLRSHLAPDIDARPVLMATCLVAGITAGTGLLLRAGSSVGAMVLALLGAGAALTTLGLGEYGQVVDISLALLMICAGTLALTAVIAARHLSHPSAW